MRTAIVTVMGIVIAAVFVGAGRMVGKSRAAAPVAFMVVWVIFCVFDYSRGVKAGYSPMAELGIHAFLFVVPSIAAWVGARMWG